MDIDKINNFLESTGKNVGKFGEIIGKKAIELYEPIKHQQEIDSFICSQSSKQFNDALNEIDNQYKEVYNEKLRRHQEIIEGINNQLIETQKQSLIHLESYREVTKINENLQKQIEFLKTESKENSKEAKISKILAIISIVISIIAIFF